MSRATASSRTHRSPTSRAARDRASGSAPTATAGRSPATPSPASPPRRLKHYMQEGIRVDNGSNYNVIDRNRISDLPGDGRAFTTDQTRVVQPVHQNNTAKQRRHRVQRPDGRLGQPVGPQHGHRLPVGGHRLPDDGRAAEDPSMATSTNDSTVTCKHLSGTGAGLQIGAMMKVAGRGQQDLLDQARPERRLVLGGPGQQRSTARPPSPTTGATTMRTGAC